MEEEKYLPELMAEKDSLDPSFVHASRLLAEEIEKFQGSDGKKEDEEKKYLDVISNKNIKLSERVLIPVKQYPKFNFVGKLLGPRGNSLKRLQEETGAKMSILGKGSMRDKAKEEELRKSGEAKYAHLSDELHVLIEVFAPPGEAYSRMSHALEEIKKFLVPSYIDGFEISRSWGKSESREMPYHPSEDNLVLPVTVMGPLEPRTRPFSPITCFSSIMACLSRGRGGAVPPPPPPGRGVLAPRGSTVTRGALPVPPVARGVPTPRARGAPAVPGYRAPPPPAHEAYEEYGYDDGYGGEYDDQTYEAYDNSYATQTQSVPEYYDYGHGVSEDAYDSYATEEWATTRSSLKAPPPRSARGGYREHPYGRY
ncbi:KH domain-containing, RNA-binding, signal transduction-associated protein 2 [Cebus imitator]|uniref:KH domain-containing, RNA-binding, signal transduction-associated protein 2 n=1 Tax=Cebus imitator TaxID=2715852 RepID=UPI00189A0A51|nr:KH domain-containing, RNA-binding, signal transduction-associated protein 2 [Cebus imitator]